MVDNKGEKIEESTAVNVDPGIILPGLLLSNPNRFDQTGTLTRTTIRCFYQPATRFKRIDDKRNQGFKRTSLSMIRHQILLDYLTVAQSPTHHNLADDGNTGLYKSPRQACRCLDHFTRSVNITVRSIINLILMICDHDLSLTFKNTACLRKFRRFLQPQLRRNPVSFCGKV